MSYVAFNVMTCVVCFLVYFDVVTLSVSKSLKLAD